mmetsp:Transcript_32134/g.102222  ORF Transcript_32134/g.102222 Transcript_32134/m.102222 type:complete len:343 (-) Transcript_32134:667-1695(-)
MYLAVHGEQGAEFILAHLHGQRLRQEGALVVRDAPLRDLVVQEVPHLLVEGAPGVDAPVQAAREAPNLVIGVVAGRIVQQHGAVPAELPLDPLEAQLLLIVPHDPQDLHALAQAPQEVARAALDPFHPLHEVLGDLVQPRSPLALELEHEPRDAIGGALSPPGADGQAKFPLVFVDSRREERVALPQAAVPAEHVRPLDARCLFPHVRLHPFGRARMRKLLERHIGVVHHDDVAQVLRLHRQELPPGICARAPGVLLPDALQHQDAVGVAQLFPLAQAALPALGLREALEHVVLLGAVARRRRDGHERRRRAQALRVVIIDVRVSEQEALGVAGEGRGPQRL